MKKNFGIIILLLALITILLAQTDFEAWKTQQQQQIQQFKNDQDKQFAEFLESSWKAFKVFTGEKQDETPKPQEVPKVELKKPKELPQKNKIKDLKLPPLPQVEAVEEILALPELESGREIELDFFRKKFILKYNDELEIDLTKPINNKKIAEYWKKMSNKEYEPILKQIKFFSEQTGVNDWGFTLLLYEAGELLYQDENLATLFTWFMLTQAGYNSKVGYNENSIKLLLASDHVFYGKPYLMVDKQRFYAVSLQTKESKQKDLYTYEGNHAEAKEVMSLFLHAAPNFSDNLNEKVVEFSYKDKNYQIKLYYNPENIRYYDLYPETNLEIYFTSPMKKKVEYQLLQQLGKLVEGKSEAEAANMLLRFVQTGFKYETDNQQFGREKAFFPEEVIYYPACDCEDRSVFYSYLIKKILSLEVIGLDYPGHVATAVNFSEKIAGDSISYKGKQYVVCDPTYINADLGMAMPEFKNIKPKIIEIN
ncbi:MAG: hypothetical protein SVM86_01195 [Candidatus Cloacimonadota bacterium]|nr:hypothetical protein [Candidatus Cloacimonadota bacterium]